MAIGTAALLGLSAGTGILQTAANVWAQKDQQAFNAEEALKAREFNSAEAQKQRDFEQSMASTQYQRAVADMQSAGLNPASLGGVFSPNAVPSGSSASGVAASGSATHFDFSNIFSTAVQYAISKDRNFEREVIAEMYNTNAREMNEATNEVRSNIAKARELNRTWDRESREKIADWWTDYAERDSVRRHNVHERDSARRHNAYVDRTTRWRRNY